MFKETRTTIYNKNIDKDIKLLVISDIHYSGIKDVKKLDKLYKKIQKYDLDYICIPGDTLDNKDVKNKEYLINWFNKISKLSTVIISLGNHDIREGKKEYKSYYDEELFNKINDIDNVYLLNNTCKSFKDIYFYGYTQSFNYYYALKKEDDNRMIKEIEEYGVTTSLPNKFKVLLMHSPIHIKNEKIKEKLDNYDLILCGHMHNGVVPPIIDDIFKNNRGIIAPNKRIFPDNARGIIKDKNIVVISSGVTKLSKSANKLIRWANIFFPIGINYIILTSKNKEFKNTCKYYI